MIISCPNRTSIAQSISSPCPKSFWRQTRQQQTHSHSLSLSHSHSHSHSHTLLVKSCVMRVHLRFFEECLSFITFTSSNGCTGSLSNRPLERTFESSMQMNCSHTCTHTLTHRDSSYATHIHRPVQFRNDIRQMCCICICRGSFCRHVLASANRVHWSKLMSRDVRSNGRDN